MLQKEQKMFAMKIASNWKESRQIKVTKPFLYFFHGHLWLSNALSDLLAAMVLYGLFMVLLWQHINFNLYGLSRSKFMWSCCISGGVADRVGGLKRGDQLLSVNGVSVEGEHHEKAVELLKAAIGSVKLVVRYTPKVLEEMEMRFDKQRQARRRQIYT